MIDIDSFMRALSMHSDCRYITWREQRENAPYQGSYRMLMGWTKPVSPAYFTIGRVTFGPDLKPVCMN